VKERTWWEKLLYTVEGLTSGPKSGLPLDAANRTINCSIGLSPFRARVVALRRVVGRRAYATYLDSVAITGAHHPG